ncbi:MAG: class I SAM-dependent methyltransferase [bacterium]|nr:class I SAM-dependent methyltransferase [bacterium]
MNQYDYWNTRFHDEGMIWAFQPCQSARVAREKFRAYAIRSLLIPGAGYGRNAKYFVDAGYTVTGIEIAERAIEIAREQQIPMRYIHGSLLDISIQLDRYDAIFCFNTLHLFLEADRRRIVDIWYRSLHQHGYGFVVALSDREARCGHGKELEPLTYESRAGKSVHYFTDSDLRTHFSRFHILETGSVNEPESRGGDQTHPCRYIFFQKGKRHE